MTKTIARSRDNKNSMNGITDLHATWLDQGVTTLDTPTFASLNISNDLTVNGNLSVLGNYTTINTEVLVLKDNLIEINSEEVGPGVTTIPGISGLQVNRGSSVAYQLVFRESDDSFCVGEEGDLQVVATREDSPLNSGVMIFNQTFNRLDSVTTLPLSMTFSSSEASTSSSTGAVKVQGGLGITGNIVSDSSLYLKGTNYSNYIKSDLSQNLILNSTGNIDLNSTGSVNLLTNSSLTFGTSSQKITYNGTNLLIDASNLLSINPVTYFNNNIASTSSNTGSITTIGGIGIANTTDASSLSNGGSFTTSGGMAVAKKLFIGGIGSFSDSTQSTSTSSGSVVTLGGIGIAKNIFVGGLANFSDSTESTSSSSGSVITLGGMGVAKNLFVSGIGNFTNVSQSTSSSSGSIITLGGIGVAKNLFVGGIGNFVDTSISTNTSTGSIVTLGGLGVAKNINIGTNLSNTPGHGRFLSTNTVSFTDNVTANSSSTSFFSSVNFGQVTLSAVNTITTVNSYTVFIEGPPIQGTNQTLSNTYSLFVNSGNTRLGGNLLVSGNITLDNNLTMQGNLDVNGHSIFDRVTILTDDGQFFVSGSNPVNINVAAQCTLSNTVGDILVDSQSGTLFLDGNTSINLNSTGVINITPGSGLPVNLTTNSPLTFGALTEKITFDGTNLIFDALNLLSINPKVSFNNTTASTSTTNGSIKYLGGLSISNSTEATSSGNGGTLTTAGGVGIVKKLFVGGLSTFENVNESVSLSILGGTTVNKKMIIGSNYSGNPESTSAVFLQTNNSTFTDNVTAQDGTVTFVNFNSFAINTLESTNTGISTTNASTLYIEGCPIAGVNQTITNCYSLHVDSGITRLDGNVEIKSTTTSTSLTVDGGVTINKNLIVNNKFDVGADIFSSPSTSGVFVSLSPRTVTDNITASSGTATEMSINVIGQPTLSSTNSITTTNASTLTIQGAPIQGTNQTLTNSYSLWIKSGNFRLDSNLVSSGTLQVVNTTESSSTSTGSFTTLGGAGIAKNLFVGGIANFQNTAESTSLTTGSLLTSGGLAVSKNLNVAFCITSGFNNFSNSAGLGKMLKTNSITFTDNTTAESGTAPSYSSVNFGQVTLASLNSTVTTTDSSTVYIQGSPIAGTNQTLTNSYALFVGSGTTKLGGTLTVSGAVSLDTNLTIQGTLDVNGPSLLDQVTINTDDGQFFVSGSNPFNINVGAQCTLTNTVGNVIVDSQAGTLFLDGNNAISLNSIGAINSTAGASSQIGVASGTLTLSAPTITTSGANINLQATTSVLIGTSSSIPITIGNTVSETTIADNLTVVGNFTVQGDTTFLASTVLTTEDNAIVVNSLPSGISDGGILIRRYQTPNNTSLGQVVTDTPLETGSFQSSLVLGTGASIITNYYRGWWIKITSGDASGFVRRIKSSNSSRVITIYQTADNTATFIDGLDLTATIAPGDTYELYPGTHSGLFYNETLAEFSIGNVPFDSGAGVFSLVGYKNLHLNRLTVEEGITFAGSALFDSQLIVDINDLQAILIRKNADSGDVFYINTTVPSLNIENPVNTVNSSIFSNFLGQDSTGASVVYSRIESKIKDNTTTSVNGELSLGVAVNSIIENYIVIDGNSGLTTINNLVSLSSTTASTSSIASLKLAGGITSTNTTDSTSVTSGGSLTTLGGASIGKRLYIGSDMFVNASALGSGTISINPSTTNGESSISFYGNTGYSGQLWTLGHGLTGSSTNSFSLYNSATSSISLTVGVNGVVSIPSTVASSSSSTGALVVSGGVGIALDLNVGGNITGTWNGTVISVTKGGTGASTFTSTAVLLGNGTSAIQAGANITYSSDLLTLPKIWSTDTTDSTSSISGSVIISGGVGIAKKLYIGTDLNIAGNVVLSATNTLIGKPTIDGTDTGSISIFSGGAVSDTRGASVVLKGNEHTSAPGSVVLSCGNVNSTGYLSIVTSSIERVNVSYDGKVTFPNTNNATSSTVGPVVISGGLAVNKDVYIGGDLYLTGALPGGTIVTNPSVATSNLVNVTSSTAVNIVSKRVYNEVTFSCAFTVVPSALNSQCSFEFALPIVTTNLANVYDVIISVNGHLTDFTPIENRTAYGVVGTTRAKVHFTSGPSTATHYIHIIANYTTN